MNSDQLTGYSGVSGRVLREAMTFRTLATGISLGAVLFIISWVLIMVGADRAVAPTAQLIVALVLSRFALNGIFGEWRGTMFSTSGGPWSTVFLIAARYVTLTAIWALPLLGFGFAPEKVADSLTAMTLGMGAGKSVFLMLLYALAMALTPPVFLIVSVAAESFGEIFSVAHWKRIFSGRLGDLFLIYVIYMGALAFVFCVTFPLLMTLMSFSPKFGLALLALDLAFMGGLAITLLGRLCGFFAFGETSGASPATRAAAPGPQAPVHGAGLEESASSGPSVSLSSAPAAQRSNEPPHSATVGMPPPPDATQPIDAAQQRFEHDPEGAISMLEDLRAAHVKHPKLLHALCLMRLQAGHEQAAVQTGREALDACVRRGHSDLTAELFRALWPQLQDLRLSRGQMLAITGALMQRQDLATAARAYASLIRNDAGDARAIKGLMKIAEIKRKKEAPQEAIKVYSFLLQHCADSPLAEYFREGLEEAKQEAA